MTPSQSPPMLIIFFWLVLFLWALGMFVPPEKYPAIIRINNAVLLALFAIVGWKLFGNPFH